MRRPVLAALLLLLVAALTAAAASAAERPKFRVLTFGDSYASGEGAPGVPGNYGPDGSDLDSPSPAVDWNGTSTDTAFTGDTAGGRLSAKRCHRSPKATSPKATKLLQGMFPDIEFTFRSFACSGARIKKGIIGDYEGAQPDGASDRVPTQISQANDYLNALPSDERVDALVMNIGGNDLGFANVIQRCTNLPPFPFEPCSPGNVSENGIGNDDTLNVIRTGEGSGEPADETGLDNLPGLYRQLDDAIDRRASSGKLAVVPRKVFLSGPPNVLAGFTGCFNGQFDYEKNLRADERAWLNSFVVPTMRDAIGAGAAARGWTFVDMIPVVPAGICSGNGRMINANRDSLPVQGATVANALGINVSHGWVHPKETGFAAMAARLADEMKSHVVDTFTPGLPAASEPAPVKPLGSRVVMRVGVPPETYDTRAAANRPAPGSGTVAAPLGFGVVDVPVPTTNNTTTIQVRRCGPVGQVVGPPGGCGPSRTVTNVLTGTPAAPRNVAVSNDPLGIRVRWERGTAASTTLRRILVSAKLDLQDDRLNPTDLLSDCPIEDDPRFGGDGPLVNGRPCGRTLQPGQVDSPVETDFEFGPDVREAVLPLARNSRWSITVRECTDRGCTASGAARTSSGLSPLGSAALLDALNSAPVRILRQDLPIGVFTTLAGRKAKRGGTFPLRVAWGTWESWQDLRELRIRLAGATGELATLRVALPSGKVTVQAPGGKARKGTLGRRGTLAAGPLSLLLRSARLADSGSKGRLVALELPLKLAKAISRQRVDVEIAATAKGKRQGFGWAGSFEISG